MSTPHTTESAVHLTNEELIQFVWLTASDRTQLEKELAERLAHACDEAEELDEVTALQFRRAHG